MTKEELMKKVEELELSLEREKSKNVNMKSKVLNLIQGGVNSMTGLTKNLDTTSKNISSVLTAIRKDLLKDNKIIITQKFNNETMIAILDLKSLGWVK